MTEKSYTEAMAEVGTQMARLEGKLDTGLAELNGSVKALTTVVEAGNQARIDEAKELRKDVDDHEGRIRAAEKAIPENLAERLSAAESRDVVTPKGLWAVVSGIAALVIAAAAVVVNAVN